MSRQHCSLCGTEVWPISERPFGGPPQGMTDAQIKRVDRVNGEKTLMCQNCWLTHSDTQAHLKEARG